MVDMKANSPSKPPPHTHKPLLQRSQGELYFQFPDPNCIRTALLSSPLSISLSLGLSLFSLLLCAAQDFQGTITWCTAPPLGPPLSLSLQHIHYLSTLHPLLPFQLVKFPPSHAISYSLHFATLLSLCFPFSLLSISQTPRPLFLSILFPSKRLSIQPLPPYPSLLIRVSRRLILPISNKSNFSFSSFSLCVTSSIGLLVSCSLLLPTIS